MSLNQWTIFQDMNLAARSFLMPSGMKNMWGRLSATDRKRRQNRKSGVPGAAVECLENRSLLSAVVVELTASQDNTIYNVHTADQANGQGQFIVTGGSQGTAAARRGLVAFDVDSAEIPDGSTILDVVLTMNLVYSTGGAATIGVHQVLKNWGEGFSDASGNEIEGTTAGAMDATWLFSRYDGIAWVNSGGDFAGVSASVSARTLGAYEWSGDGLVDDVQGWLDNPFSNFGWLVKSSELAGNIKSFSSRNSANVALQPKLEITYEEPFVPAIVEGRKWHDKNANGLRESAATLGLNLQFPGDSSRYNSYGGKEYWYQSATNKRWYFLTPDGNLTQWSGKAKSLTGKVVDRLDSQVWYSPETLLGSTDKSPEPWMNGFVFQMVDASGKVVDAVASRDIDRNGDGVIQEESERGWYQFIDVKPGNYTIREVVPDGWVQSASFTSPGAAEAYRLDTSLGLTLSGTDREDFGGLDERWLKGTSGWYYITPVGDFYRWNGKAVTDKALLSGTWIAAPGISYYRDISLLHAAKNPVLTVSAGQVLSRVDFGNYRPVIITGTNRLSDIPAWIRNSPRFVKTLVENKPDPTYVWEVLVIDTKTNDSGSVTYGGQDPYGTDSVWGSKTGRPTGYGAPKVKASSLKLNLSALDQGAYRIVDVLFSEFRMV